MPGCPIRVLCGGYEDSMEVLCGGYEDSMEGVSSSSDLKLVTCQGLLNKGCLVAY